MRGLENKNVIVTGGASGIGQATAARFLEEGCSVCVIDRSDEARASVVKELPGLSGAIDADVASFEQVQSAFAEAVESMGSVDILINNAGISIRHDFLDSTPEEWDRVVDVNLKGVFYMAQVAARHMLENGAGVILNTASTAGSTGYPHYADYSASKGGVIALTLAMSLELLEMLATAPELKGWNGLGLALQARGDLFEALPDRLLGSVDLLGRRAKPEEIAALFAFLASEDAAFATGQVYVMDGAETTGGLCSQWTHEVRAGT